MATMRLVYRMYAPNSAKVDQEIVYFGVEVVDASGTTEYAVDTADVTKDIETAKTAYQHAGRPLIVDSSIENYLLLEKTPRNQRTDLKLPIKWQRTI